MNFENASQDDLDLLENRVIGIEEELTTNDDNISQIVEALRLISSILSQKHDTSELDSAINSINY